MADLPYLNRRPVVPVRPGLTPPRDPWDTLEARVRGAVPVRDVFVRIPFPRLASTSDRQIAQAVESYKREAAVVDARLAREVTLQHKATALADLCELLRGDTGLQLAAGQSVADEKVTVFCRRTPLRDLMRQLSRPFGYTWLRSRVPARAAERSGLSEAAGAGAEGEYKYELVQDLRSQLLEEELRNRDRNGALLALDREMGRYRPYMGLSADEALARARTAAPAEKKLLENYARDGWGAVQMYFRLSPRDLATLRAGRGITFSAAPKPGEQPLPPELAPGVLQSLRRWRVRSREDGFAIGEEKDLPDGLLPMAVPEVKPLVALNIDHSELGQFTFNGGSGLTAGGSTVVNTERLADGISPAVRDPQNEIANARLAGDAALRPRITLRPRTSCRPDAAEPPGPARQGGDLPLSASGDRSRRREATPGAGGGVNTVTRADVLEALHRASGLPIVADDYTRLYPVEELAVKDRPLFEALNRLADAMRLHWSKDGSWLQFRSATYYDDRLKEVPNRLLSRWAASRAQHGALTLDDLIEVTQLTETQLDSSVIAEGARDCWGLAEWDLARGGNLRPHLRFLAQLTPAQRNGAQTAAGLPFTRMSLAQQQEFIARAVGERAEQPSSLDALAIASLRLEYEQPGWFRWELPDGTEGPRRNRSVKLSLVRERTRETALQAARRIDPQVPEAQIAPTELAMRLRYSLGDRKTGGSMLEVCITPGGATGRTNIWQPGEDPPSG